MFEVLFSSVSVESRGSLAKSSRLRYDDKEKQINHNECRKAEPTARLQFDIYLFLLF